MPNDIPLVTVSSLEALAYNVSIERGYICSLIDARNNQVYAGIFDNNYNLCKDYMADDINVVLDIVNKYGNIHFVGNGTSLLASLNESIDNNIHSKNVGIAGYRKYINGEKLSADEIIPMYLRPSQAERMRNKDG